MKRKVPFLLSALVMSGLATTAQVSTYGFTQTAGSYGPALTGTQIGAFYQDDDPNLTSLPFTFNFNGVNSNTVNVSSNGFLSFDAITGTEYNPISDMGTSRVISPFGQDLHAGILVTADLSSGSNTLSNVSFVSHLSVGDTLVDAFGDFSTMFPVITAISGNSIVLNANAVNTFTTYDVFIANGRIKKEVSGSAPNRICTFEFRKFSRFFVYNESISFKIRLYETSNKIEFVYGNIVVGSNYSNSEVGLKGNSTSDFHSRFVDANNTWATSTLATSVTDAADFEQSNFPANGQTYIWAPACAFPNFSVAPSSTVICSGQSATLTAAGAATYSWTGIGTNTQIVVSPTSNTTYTLTGTNGACSASLTQVLNVNPSPTLSVAQTNTLPCAGETITLTASGANTYTWTGMGTGAQIIVSPASAATYTLAGQSGSCTASITVIQNVAPSPSLVITQQNPSICKGESSTITVSGATSYSWTGIGTSAQIVVSPSVISIYTVTGFANGCSAVKMVTQTVNSVPAVQVSLTSNLICAGETTTINATGATSYTWSTGSLTPFIQVSPQVTTVYTVTGSNGACARTTTISQPVSECLSVGQIPYDMTVSAFPNPFSSELWVVPNNNEICDVIVKDLTGRTIITKSQVGSAEAIDTSEWSKGVYLVTVQSNGQVTVKKVVKD